MVARQDTPPPVQHPESVSNKNTMPSASDDNSGPCFPSNNQSPKVNSRRRGRPRNQIPAVTTNRLTIEPRRELRKRGPAGVQTNDDPWVKLSKAPFVTSLSPQKVPRSGPTKHRPVILPSCHAYKMF
jgi:hypothetical protein